MKILLEAISYDKFKWQICVDLKVITLLLGLQGFTASFVNGTAELGVFITQLRTGVPENPSNQEIIDVENQPLVEPSKFFCHPCI